MIEQKIAINNASFLLDDETVAVWEVRFSKQKDNLKKYYAVLNEEERARAARFYFEKDQQAFTIARGSLKLLLSEYLKVKTQKIIFSQNEYGKPELQDSSWQFNVSHSHDYALIAIGRNHPLGIDVEYRDRKIEPLALCERFFAKEEIEQLQSVASSERVKTFFNFWTRKEAFIKAVGMGLSFGLDQFAVTGLPGVTPKILRISSGQYKVDDWQLSDISLDEPYAGALMCSTQLSKISRIITC